MPSHLDNWMKAERKKIQDRNKRVEHMLKYGDLGKAVNYELKQGNVMEDVFRKQSKALTSEELQLIDDLKSKADELYCLFDKAFATRELAIAKTNLEQAVMWAVKAITK